MKRLTTLAIALMLSGVFATATLAAQDANQTTPAPEKAQAVEKTKGNEVKKQGESEGLQLQKEYFKKRQDAKARRDAALELRRKNISRGNPGDTGM
jgi:hypothetical protein